MRAMTAAALFAFALFALVASITPGPNNLMLLASGVNFGFRPTIPHMLGITVGFFAMLVLVGLGLAEFFARVPQVYAVLRWVGAAYLIYLAYRIATSGPTRIESGSEGSAAAKPLGFLGATLFQWVNPKAWAMAVTAFSTYVPTTVDANWLLGISLLFAVVNLPCIACWTLFGTWLRHWLQEPASARRFNGVMAALLVLSLVPMLR